MSKRASALTIGGEIKHVPLGKMRTSSLSQRDLKPARVKLLVAEMDLDQLGILEVNERGDGWFYIIDGQHRAEALRQWLGDGWESQTIECRVWKGLTEKQEARKFDLLNNVLSVSSFDRFRVRVNYGHHPQAEIARIVESIDLKISREAVEGAVSSVTTLEKVFSRAGGEILKRTLCLVRDAYGDAGLKAPVIAGIGLLCQRYNGVMHDEHAIERLSQAHAGVAGLLNRAEVYHRQTGNTKPACVAAAAVDTINAGRGGQKLPDWWKTV